MPDTSKVPARKAQYTIRQATVDDLDWLNSNEEGWIVYEHAGHMMPYSLNKAWAVLIADDSDGNPLGWLYVLPRINHLTLQLLYVDPRHRRHGIARVLVEHLFSDYPGEIVLGGWDRSLFEVWIKLGFVYVPPPGDDRHQSGDMIRPPVR